MLWRTVLCVEQAVWVRSKAGENLAGSRAHSLDPEKAGPCSVVMPLPSHLTPAFLVFTLVQTNATGLDCRAQVRGGHSGGERCHGLGQVICEYEKQRGKQLVFLVLSDGCFIGNSMTLSCGAWPCLHFSVGDFSSQAFSFV